MKRNPGARRWREQKWEGIEWGKDEKVGDRCVKEIFTTTSSLPLILHLLLTLATYIYSIGLVMLNLARVRLVVVRCGRGRFGHVRSVRSGDSVCGSYLFHHKEQSEGVTILELDYDELCSKGFPIIQFSGNELMTRDSLS